MIMIGIFVSSTSWHG